MILADKIIRLRKQNGWSQEELAERMHVSRQADSKWEAAQTTPDFEKILMLSKLFGVSTDYLLKDELEQEEFTDDTLEPVTRQLTMEEANAYLAHRKWASVRIALATILCILSPVCLILMGGASEAAVLPFNEHFSGFCGWQHKKMRTGNGSHFFCAAVPAGFLPPGPAAARACRTRSDFRFLPYGHLSVMDTVH